MMNMCTAILFYNILDEYPIIFGENRDAYIETEEIAPHIISKNPKIFSALDKKSNGTWFGLNEYGVVVGLTNLYPQRNKPKNENSRGKLCIETLKQPSAEEVTEFLKEEFDPIKYKNMNIISVDEESAFLTRCCEDTRVSKLKDGIHIFTNYDFVKKPRDQEEIDLWIDSKHREERAKEILKRYQIETLDDAILVMGEVFRDHERPNYPSGSEEQKYFTICCHSSKEYLWRTTSSSILVLSTHGFDYSKYFYLNGNPCENRYDDYSYLLEG